MRAKLFGLVVMVSLAAPAASSAALPDLDVRDERQAPAASDDIALLTGPSGDAPERVVLDYVRDHPASSAPGLKLVARSVSPDGITHLRYNQTIAGIESFDSGLDAHVTKDGRLIAVTGRTVPDAKLPDTTPAVSALASLGEARRSARGLALPPKVRSAGATTTFATGEVAKLRWIATDDGARLAWNVITDGEDGDAFNVVVDAESGDTLVRTSLTHDAGGARFFPRDPDTSAVTTITMPPSWYDQSNGGTRLWGQYSRTYIDPDDQDPAQGAEEGGTRVQIPASGGAPGSPDWLYTRSTNFPGATPCPPSGCSWNSAISASRLTNQFQAATNVHVLVGRYLEYLAQPPIGFDDASGAFRGNDYVRTEVNDGQGLNNANFATFPDGTPPRMQMFLFTARDANGSDSADVVYHELTHGLSGRLIVNASGVSALGPQQSSMMNEGWSDYYAADLLVSQGLLTDTATPGELKLGTHVVGPGGIRNKPLDCPVGPGGVVGCNANGTGVSIPGGYTYGDIKDTDNTSPHNGGELWAATLWDLRNAVGRDAALALVAGGQRLTADNPSMLDARDGILLQALASRSAPGAPDDHFDEVWQVFRARGMGFDASTPDANSTTPVENYNQPRNALYGRSLAVSDPYPGGDNDGRAEPGELVSVSAPFYAAGLTDLPGVTGTLTSPSPGVTIVDGTATWALLGNGRTAANGDPLTARMPTSCDTAVSLKVDVASADGSIPAQTSIRLRPSSRAVTPIADAPSGAVDGVAETTYEVPPGGTITDVDVRIDDLRHTFLGDIKVEVIHAGETVLLFDAPAAWAGDDIIDAIFDSDSATPVNPAGPGPVTGRLRPADATGLNRLDGKPAGGTWTLRVTDNEPGDAGVINEWGADGPRAQFPCPRLEIPEATTGAASGETASGATVTGTVDPNARATGLRFAYGTTDAYGAATATQDVGAGDGPVAGSAALSGLEPGTTYHYRAEAIREGGAVAVAGADRTFTTAPAPVVTPSATPIPTPAADRTAPTFTGKPKVKLTKAGKKNQRATFSFTLSEPATVSAVVTRATPGIKKGSKCVAVPKKKPKKAKACTRQVSAARGTASAGARTLALPAKGLGKGKYTATLTAVDGAGNRSSTKVSFTIR